MLSTSVEAALERIPEHRTDLEMVNAHNREVFDLTVDTLLEEAGQELVPLTSGTGTQFASGSFSISTDEIGVLTDEKTKQTINERAERVDSNYRQPFLSVQRDRYDYLTERVIYHNTTLYSAGAVGSQEPQLELTFQKTKWGEDEVERRLGVNATFMAVGGIYDRDPGLSLVPPYQLPSLGPTIGYPVLHQTHLGGVRQVTFANFRINPDLTFESLDAVNGLAVGMDDIRGLHFIAKAIGLRVGTPEYREDYVTRFWTHIRGREAILVGKALQRDQPLFE